MKTRILITVGIAIIIASCGTQKQVVKEKVVIPPPTGVVVMDTTTKVFSSIKLPKNDNWVIKNEDATFRHDEFLVKKMDDWKQISIIRTLSYGTFSADLNDAKAVTKSIDNYAAGVIIQYNDFHFKKDGNGDKIEDPIHTTKLDTLKNGYVVVIVEAEVKITNKEYKTFGNSYYALNYYFLAKKDEKNCIPIISSSTLLKPENYETDKKKFIELVDYVVNTAVVNPEYKFKK